MSDTPLIESLAAHEHEQWAHWMRYMTANMTPENMERWKRQMNTPYAELTEKEKESDREWARKAVGVMAEYLQDEMVRKQQQWEAHLVSFERMQPDRHATNVVHCDVLLRVPEGLLAGVRLPTHDVVAKAEAPDGAIVIGGNWPTYYWVLGPANGGEIPILCAAYGAVAEEVYAFLQCLPHTAPVPVSMARSTNHKQDIPDYLPVLR